MVSCNSLDLNGAVTMLKFGMGWPGIKTNANSHFEDFYSSKSANFLAELLLDKVEMKEESGQMVRETWIRSINDNASKSQTLLVTTEKGFF